MADENEEVRLCDLTETREEFYDDDVVVVDSKLHGTAKMPAKDRLPQNVLAGRIAPPFVPNVTEAKAGVPYMYGGNVVIAKEDYQGSWDSSKFESINVSEFIKYDKRFKALAANAYYGNFPLINGGGIVIAYNNPNSFAGLLLVRKVYNQRVNVLHVGDIPCPFEVYFDGVRAVIKNKLNSDLAVNLVVGSSVFVESSELPDDWDSDNVTIVPIIEQNNNFVIFATGLNFPYLEETDATTAKCYFSIANNGSIKYGCRGNLTEVGILGIATSIGVSLVTSPKGQPNCIEIADGKALVADKSDSLALVDLADVNGRTIILYCSGGRFCYNIIGKSKDFYGITESTLVYVNLDGYPYIEGNYYGIMSPTGAERMTRVVNKLTQSGRELTMTQLATELGVSLVTTPKGKTDCIQVSNGNCLVVSPNGKFEIKPYAKVHIEDYVVLDARGDSFVKNNIQDYELTLETIKEDLKTVQVYITLDGVPYLENCFDQGKAYFSIISPASDERFVKVVGNRVSGGSGRTLSMSALATELGVSLVTSPNGKTDCIEIANNMCLVVDVVGKFALKNRSSVFDYEKILLDVAGGYFVSNEIYDYVDSSIGNLSISTGYRLYPKTKYDNHNENIIDCGSETESFVVFSDPHCLGSNGVLNSIYNVLTKSLINSVNSIISETGIRKVLSFGDWLNSGDSKIAAIRKLQYIGGQFNRDKDFIFVAGNHDTNAYGVSGDSLSVNEMFSALDIESKSLYYKVEKDPICDYFVFDSGLASPDSVTSYRYDQLKAFAEYAVSSIKRHCIVLIHMFSNGYTYPENWTSGITNFAKKLMEVIAAINSRSSSYSIDGQTYDFSNAVVEVAFVLSGHTHYDYVDTSFAVPVISITNTFASYSLPNQVLRIDLGFVDFTKRKLYLSRIDESSSREISF